MRAERPLRVALALALLLACGSCAGDLDAPQPLASLDEPYFRCRVQPILTKSCSMLACHGDAARFFHFYARNRLRLGGTERDRNSFLRDDERRFNFLAASAMVDTDRPGESLLLQKPLDVRAGGWFHEGAELYGGGDVFASTDDAEYRVLRMWAEGATEDPACVEPGSDR